MIVIYENSDNKGRQVLATLRKGDWRGDELVINRIRADMAISGVDPNNKAGERWLKKVYGTGGVLWAEEIDDGPEI